MTTDNNKLEYTIPADNLLAMFQPIAGLKTIDGLTVHIDPDNVSVAVMDQAKVSMIQTIWMVDTGLTERRDLNLDFGDVMKVLSLFKGQDVTVTVADGKVRVKGDKAWRKIALLDKDLKTDFRMPNFDLPTQVITTTGDLLEAFGYLSDLSDHLAFRVRDGRVTVDTSNDIAEGEYTLPQEAIGEDVRRACYPWDYVTGIVKKMLDGDIIIRMATDYPVQMVTTRGDIQTTVIIAPRIEEEDP